MENIMITVSSSVTEKIASLELSKETTFETLLLLVETELSIPYDQIKLHYRDGKPFRLEAQQTVSRGGLKHGSHLVASVRPAADTPTNSMEEKAMHLIEQNKVDNGATATMIEGDHPDLAKALRSGDIAAVKRQLEEASRMSQQVNARRQELLRKIETNPFDTEAQKLLEEMIQQQNINEQLAMANEVIPEAFAPVHMLYIKVEVNGHPVNAFIDSGAQATLMSRHCAERCGIMRLVDKRWSQLMSGIGQQRSLGRVHMGQIKIGNAFIAASFSVMEHDGVEFLFGLDLLKRHNCMIDLKGDCLVINNQRIRFLSETECETQPQSQSHSTPSPKRHASLSAGTASSQRASLTHTSNNPAQADMDRQKVQQLQQLGFSETEAQRALTAAGGDIEVAGSLLFQSRAQ